MKSRSLILTATARKDLLETGRYTEKTWGKTQRNSYLIELDATFQLIRSNTKIGLHRPELKEGFYSLPHAQHVVFYVFDKNTVTILAIVHKAMDVDRRF
jgi:toxin ParE1/3/4